MHALDSTAGYLALGASVVAVLALLGVITLAVRLSHIGAAQRVVLGDRRQDLVAHAAGLAADFRALRAHVEESATRLDGRMGAAEGRLDGAIAYSALVRYDAYGEMSGRQSLSIALLDATRSGIVLSSIHHRDQARLYARSVHDGRAELELSPEEAEAIAAALGGATASGVRGGGGRGRADTRAGGQPSAR